MSYLFLIRALTFFLIRFDWMISKESNHRNFNNVGIKKMTCQFESHIRETDFQIPKLRQAKWPGYLDTDWACSTQPPRQASSQLEKSTCSEWIHIPEELSLAEHECQLGNFLAYQNLGCCSRDLDSISLGEQETLVYFSELLKWF